MFARFHVLVLPGGAALGAQQASLLEQVVTAHGGSIVSDTSMVASVERSVARRRQRRLVVISGRDAVQQLETDFLLARCGFVPRAHAARMTMTAAAAPVAESDEALERRAVVAQEELAVIRGLLGTTVFYAKPEWITASVSIGASEPQDLAAFSLSLAAAPDDGATAAVGRGSNTADQRNIVTTSDTKAIILGPKYDRGVDGMSTPGKVRGGGFIPVFFGQSDLPRNDHHDGRRLHQAGGNDGTEGEGEERATPQGTRESSLDTPPLQQFHLSDRALCHPAAKRPRSDEGSDGVVVGENSPTQTDNGVSGGGRHSITEVRWMPSSLAIAGEVRHTEMGRSQRYAEVSATGEIGDAYRCSATPHDASVLGRQSSQHRSTSPDAYPVLTSEFTATATVAQNSNEVLLSQLAELKSIYQATGDTWRTYAYHRAIAIIKRLPFRVERVEQLSTYHGIGERIRNKVREILETGSTMKLQVLQAAPQVGAMTTFTKIWGVGPATARRLAAAGLNDIAALRAAPNVQTLLTPQQLAGLRHYEDLLERIPRHEVTEIVNYVRAALTRLLGANAHHSAQIDVVACGSYRRGKPTSGDVDVLLCDRRAQGDDTLLTRLVKELGRQQTKQPLPPKMLQRFASHTSSGSAVAPLDSEKRGCCGLQKMEAAGSLSSSSPPANSPSGTADDHSASAGAFIQEDLTVSHRGAEQVHCDSWFGIVQLPDCAEPHLCHCSHRNDTPTTGKGEKDGKLSEGATSPPQLSVAERYARGKHLCRRLDLKLYPPHQFPFALLYFTGSDYFNRSMRQYCQDHGWTLSDKELKPVVQVRGATVHDTAHGIACRTERDIFEAIGLPFKEPHEREI